MPDPEVDITFDEENRIRVMPKDRLESCEKAKQEPH
eukprot:CAMPEP_0197633248 /NCGR_PEP_ID=MMETSP1338-20131121/9648_1 /TAXON_ID=43686 ORGANISM="Pelagodinium beii, Strain RCC1491" /NCGR_SAMPLE_ID=MMETSP1338 /ASSEMBLY_ACC=CAM_ASM_000754 /LENGTH=35 /DNA_ID= /DNA_START= /DNA_END= /DNA_ORIENTATION=